jgi:quinol monooxygenase YgiN
MLIVHVFVSVKAEHLAAFTAASLDNARHSLEEPGVLRFDVLQDGADPARFVLHEVYLDEEALAAHKQTAHYARWRDTVADMMAEPRRSSRYTPVFPVEPAQWKTASSHIGGGGAGWSE